jgi:hypothetical protein
MAAPRDLEEVVEFEKSRMSPLRSFLASMSPVHLIFIMLLLIYSIYLIRNTQINKNLIFGGVLVVALIVWFGFNKTKEKEPIPEHILKNMCLRAMKRKIGYEFPYGTQFFIIPYFHMRYQGYWGEGFNPFKSETAVRVCYPDGRRKDVMVIWQPFKGTILRIKPIAAGYRADEGKDLQVITPKIQAQATPVAPTK